MPGSSPASSLRSTRSSSSNSSSSIKKSVSFKLDDVAGWQPPVPPQPPPLPPLLPRSALHALPASAQPRHVLASSVRFMELQRPGEPASARLPVAVKRVGAALGSRVSAALLQAGPHANVARVLGTAPLPCDTEQLVVSERLRADLVDVQGQAPSPRELLELAVQAARGLRFLHSQLLCHGDVKPESVLLSARGVVQLCDFDLLRHASWPPDGAYQGTAAYAAPELLPADAGGGGCGGRTPASDVWAFGCTLFALFSGSLPFGGAALAARGAASRAHKRRGAPPPAAPDGSALASFGAALRGGLRPAVGLLLASDPPLPLALAALIDDCLAGEARERPSMEEVLAQLKAARRALPLAGLPARHLLRVLLACGRDADLARQCSAAFAGRAAAEAESCSGGVSAAPTAPAEAAVAAAAGCWALNAAETYQGALAQHLGDAETCASLVGVLPACAAPGALCQAAQAQALLQGALPLLVRALQVHVAHEGVCLAAARAVQAIAAGSGEHAAALARAGAAAALLAAGEAHGWESGAGEAAWAALAELEARGAQRGGCCAVV